MAADEASEAHISAQQLTKTISRKPEPSFSPRKNGSIVERQTAFLPRDAL